MDEGLRIINTVDNSQLEQSFRQAQQTIRNSADIAVREGERIDATFNKVAKTMAAMAAGFSIKEIVGQIVRVRGEFQQLEVAFTTMLGSAEKANALMEQLTKTAAITPFDLKGVTEGAKQLLAYGVAADEVNDTLIHLGDIAAGLSLPLGDLVYLYGTTLTQGRMFTQDLRQFMGRGIPIAEELAKQFGVTKDKVQELVSTGKVGAEEFKKAIMSMSSEGGKFGGLMEAQSKTITGQISNIEDAIDNMFNEIGQKSEGVINKALSGISFLIENYETIGKIILTVAAAYGAYKAALLAVIAAQKLATVWGEVQAFLSLARSITTAKDAMLLFNMVCKASPIGLLLGAVTAAAVAFGLFSSSTGKASIEVEKYGKSAAATIEKVRTLSNELKGLSANSSLHRQVMDELNQILSQYGVAQIQEGDNIDMVNSKREKAIELIKQEGIERQRLNALDAGQQSYLQKMKDAKDELLADLQEAQQTTDLLVFYWLSSADEVQKNAEAISVIAADVVERNLDKIAGKTGEAYEKGLKEIYAELQRAMANAGLPVNIDKMADNDTFGHDWILEEFIGRVKIAKDELNKYNTAVEAYADSMREATDATEETKEVIHGMTTDEEGALVKVRDAADFTQTSTQDLVKKMIELQKACDEIDREIDIKIKLGANITFDNDDVMDFTDLGNAKAEIQNRINKATNDAAVDALLKDLRAGQASADYGSTERATFTKYINQLQARKDANSGKRNGKGDAERKRREQERNMREYERMQKDFNKRREEIDRDLSQSIIDIERDNATKELMQLQHDHKNEMAELEREKEDYIQKKIELEQAKAKANGQTYTTPTNKADVLDEEEQRIFAQREKNLQERQAKETADFYKRQNAALYDYIKEYGSIYQQKEAIAKEYEQKIADETDAIQKATLAKERDRLINELNMKVLRKSIDWETVFNDLNRLSTDYLRDLRDKLRTALREGNLDAKDAEVISAKILEIENRITDKTDFWSSLIPALKERVRLTNEVAEAEERIKDARGKADRLQNKAIGQISDITSANEGSIRQVWNSLSHEPKDILEYFGIDATSDKGKELTATLIDLTQATEEATDAEKHKANVNEMLKGGKIGDIFSNAVDAAGGGAAGIISVINSNAQSMSELVDKVGLENTDFGQAVHGFSEGVGGFQSAVQSLANGDVVGAVNGVLDGIAGFGKMGINALIGGGNEDENEKEIEELTKSQDRLTNAINGLAEKILKSDATNEQSVEYYKKAYDAEKEWEEKQRKKIDDRASEYANTGYGFLGLGGRSSFNYFMDKNWSGWNVFSNILRQHQGESGVTHDSVNKNNIWDLSPEEMKLLMEFAPKRWEELFNGDGHRNPESLVNEYIEHAGELEKLTSALNEKLTGYSWDGFLDSYKSLLKDMTSSTEDFADHINEIITNALIESFVNEELKDDIKELYEYIAEHAQDGIDAEEQAEIERRNKAIEEKGLRWRQTMIDSGRIKTDDEYKQQASTKGFQAMSQDTGNELNGRFTAIQIGVYDIKDLAVKGQEMLAEMKNTQGNISTRVEAIQEAIALSNVYLSKIEKASSITNEKLDILKEIRDELKNL